MKPISFKRGRAMRGATFLCFVLLVNICASLAENVNGGATKYDSNETRHIGPSHRSLQENMNRNPFKTPQTWKSRQEHQELQGDINGRSFKPPQSRISKHSRKQHITRVKPNHIYSNGQRRNGFRPIPGRRGSLSTLNYTYKGHFSQPSPHNVFKEETKNESNNRIFRDNRPTRDYFDGKSDERQCSAIKSLPPPESECCGIDIYNFTRTQNALWGRTKYLARDDLGANSHIFKRDTSGGGTTGGTVDSNTYSDRIVGGRPTHFEQFPWTVLIRTHFTNGHTNYHSVCGGAIISARYVLTAAHCIRRQNNTLSDIQIYLSEFDKSTFPEDCEWEAGEGQRCIYNIRMGSENYLVHPQFDENPPYLEHDIALIRLSEDANFTRYIQPICLPPFDIDHPKFANFPLAVAGWGLNGSSTSHVKQATVVRLMPQENCSRDYYPPLTRSHLCAAGRTGEDACRGDSGSPLMMLVGGKHYVSGVMSGKLPSFPCGTPNVPSLYTNVYRHLDWIKNNVK